MSAPSATPDRRGPGLVASIACVLRRELGSLIDSAVPLVAGFAFCVLLHALFFYAGYPIGRVQAPPFFAGRIASLHVVFAWIPLLLAFLAPALTMGSWADERRSGTLDLLASYPLAPGAAVIGKALAAWLLTAFLITAGVAPLAILAASLGPLDLGVVAAGWLGALALAAACLMLGSWISALAGDPLIAFLVGSLVLLFCWLGGLLAPTLPGPVAELAFTISPQAHYLDTLARGLVDLRDLLWLGGATLTFGVLTHLTVESRRMA